MKNKIKLIVLLLLLAFGSAQAQTSLDVRIIDASGDPVTGLTGSNIKFKASPYTGAYLTGLTVTEKGTQGNYIVTGFTTFQLVKMYINDVEQQWLGEQYTGDPTGTFVEQASTETITGDKTFTGQLIATDVSTFTEPYISSTATVPTSDMLVWKSWVEANTVSGVVADSFFIIRDNRLLVDSKLATDIAGLQYNDIGSAITYASTYVTSGSQWTIYILPNHTGTYIESVTLPDYIHLVGIGHVAIRGYFTRTGSVALSSRIENLYFEVYDANHTITRSMVYNCVFQTFVDVSDGGTITVTSSFINNTGLFGNYTGGGDAVISGQNNSVFNSFGNFNVGWYSNDHVLEYEYDNSTGFRYYN